MENMLEQKKPVAPTSANMMLALKYATSTIELTLEETPGQITIHVDNDGPEIPEGQEEKIFQIFYQLPDHKKQMPGTGIGLAFSKSLAKTHQGTLSAQNLPTGGCSFTLSLPLEKSTTETVEQAFMEKEESVADMNLPEEKRTNGADCRGQYRTAK